MEIEYRVRPVTRYIVTRYHSGERSAGCETCGEFDNMDRANTVAEALHKSESGSVFSKLIDPGFTHDVAPGPVVLEHVDRFPLRSTPA